MSTHPCLDCGEPTTTTRCSACAPDVTYQRHNSAYDSGAYRRLRARTLAAWRRRHGNLCPGFNRKPHVRADLTLDHTIPLSQGGAVLDRDNVGVLCSSCNSLKGASLDGRPDPRAVRRPGAAA